MTSDVSSFGSCGLPLEDGRHLGLPQSLPVVYVKSECQVPLRAPANVIHVCWPNAVNHSYWRTLHVRTEGAETERSDPSLSVTHRDVKSPPSVPTLSVNGSESMLG